jgi:nicotinamidase-related amidase
MISEKERMKEIYAPDDISQFYTDGQVWHELASREDEIVIKKSSYGKFFDSPLKTILKNMVIICDILTSYC